jgi:hypothetical protein
VNHQKHRIRTILALDEHPLLDAIDFNPDLFRDAVGQRSALAVKKGSHCSAAPDEQAAYETHQAGNEERK